MIARCHGAADVVAALGYARERGTEVRVRRGSGIAVAEGGVVIDLSGLAHVDVDPAARRARVGGGALLGAVDAATLAHGLATPLGMISHTGVGDLTLSGGMGWLTRKFGLSVDNLESAEVVLADGRVVRASACSHPDLFWALRGGGVDLGVVTDLVFRLHPVSPMIELGFFFWSLDQGAAALRTARDLAESLAPDLTVVVAALNAPPAPFVPPEHHFAPGYVLMLVGFDGTPAHADAVARIRAELPPTFDIVTPMPYVALQQMLYAGNAWGDHAYIRATYVDDLSDGVIDVLTDRFPRKDSPMSVIMVHRLDGAFSQVPDDATAFGGGRSPRFGTFVVGLSPDPELVATDRSWVRDTVDALRPAAIGEDRVRTALGTAKFERLARIKGEYDPGNVFHLDTTIKPI